MKEKPFDVILNGNYVHSVMSSLLYDEEKYKARSKTKRKSFFFLAAPKLSIFLSLMIGKSQKSKVFVITLARK